MLVLLPPSFLSASKLSIICNLKTPGENPQGFFIFSPSFFIAPDKYIDLPWQVEL